MNKAKRSGLFRNQRGLAAVETALVLPLLVMILVSFVDFGRYMWARDVVREAAAEGLRMAVLVETTEEEVAARVVDEFDRGGLRQTPLVSVGPRSPGQPVTVAVSADFEFMFLPNVVEEIVSPQGLMASAQGLCER